MGTMLIAYRNHADTAVYSGGAWSAGLPASNLGDRQPSLVARTETAATSDSWIDIDFGAQKPVSFIAVIRHNLTQSGRWRSRFAVDPAFAEVKHDTGFAPIWPTITPFGVGIWGEFNWGGRLSGEEAATYGISAIVTLPTPVIARYARIEFVDASNSDGYLQAGRLFVGTAWRPSINLQYGWSIEQIDPSRRVRSRGGQSFVDLQPRYRSLRFSIDYLEKDEMMGNAYELQRLKGIGGDIFVVVDPDDTTHRHRHTVYGVIRETAPIINPVPDRFSKAFTVDELL